MSYDLMVFDALAAPLEREAFMAWYRAQTGWSDGHSYDDAALTTAELCNWYRAMLAKFPAMNGPDAPDRSAWQEDSPLWDDPHFTDYSIGRQVIYCAFAPSVADNARKEAMRRASQHGVGLFDVSEPDGMIFFPDGLTL
ncbi:hypothetical protein SZ64_06850 [Erythrobacter sp. SG61-1L]|uniref:hypothetical protein n=1 Tax=Erythrobacter sp. SG61-1L TaxID=1603897 RepID=UPI0006C900FB|nr:hypothetical protein [Erythrobacter sp. SG61-1L]KPL67856.1 hypothetical protein SZ64_06850 [Erythrobacter sp. SG61-1L]